MRTLGRVRAGARKNKKIKNNFLFFFLVVAAGCGLCGRSPKKKKVFSA
jgi:hypothetical protein